MCRAGVGDDGVLTAIVNFVAGDSREGLGLRVSGLRTGKADEFIDWVTRSLKVGDEVRVKIIETNSVDAPVERKRRNRTAELRSKKRYVRESARQFGWKIVEKTSSSH